jgi:hypothetical protein
VTWIYIRDRIVINEDLAKEIDDEIAYRKLKKGSTLLLAARRIDHTKDYVLRLEGFNLILVAESYDGNGGAIDTSGSPGANGTAGAAGKSKIIGSPVKAGDPGQNGTPGGPGPSASSITLIAAKISEAHLIARGGNGGAGGAGGKGGNGAPGKAGVPNKFPTVTPGPGGHGGNGANGGAGGNGAQITVRYVSLANPLQLDAAGGAGGTQGAAGPGGKGGAGDDVLPAVNGPAGKAGTTGAAGSPDVPIKRQYSSDGVWWSYVVPALGNQAQEWAKYRTRVGEYHFRKYKPGIRVAVASRVPVLFRVASLREQALHEFTIAMRLWTHADEARQLAQYINFNQSPIGVPYNHYLVPDFERYEEVVTDYGPMVQSLFQVASDLLTNAADVSNNRGRLAGELGHVKGLAVALDSDQHAAEIGAEATKAELELAKTRLATNQAKLDALHDEMKDESMELAGKILGTVASVATAIVAVAGAVWTSGASLGALAAIPGLLVNIQGALNSGSVDSQGNYVSDSAGDMSGWVNWSAEGGPELTPEAKKLVGGLEDLVKKSKDFYDKFETVKDLFESKVDGELESKEKELLMERVELTMARNIVELKTLQSGLLIAAAKQRTATAQADIQNLEEQAKTLGANIALLAQIARVLIRHAQGYADILTKYRFFAARAVDLWTTKTDWSKSFSFAYGYLNPDVEEHAFLAASRGNPSRMLGLLQSYLETWATLPGLIDLRDNYEEHLGKLEPHRKFVSITDPKSLALFKDAGTISVAVDGIPADQLSPKVESVYVALVGATSQFPNVEIDVEHPGDARGAPPALAPVQCTFSSGDLRPVPTDVRLRFWARDPSALWRLSVDPVSAADSQLDLTNLTEILFTIDYRSIPA